MNLPFSLDPADYDMVKVIFANHNVTPVILVLGGSYGQNMTHVKSDLDIFGVFSEDQDEIEIWDDERTVILGNYQNIQITLHSMNDVKKSIADPYQYNDPPRRMWFYEEFMSFPRIWDTPAAESYRKELAKIDPLTVAGWYLESGDWYIEFMPDTTKFTTRVTRIFLSGARLLEVGDNIIDYEVLTTWTGISTPTEARRRLVDAINT